jgi:GGDEF domain-containing protein
MAEMQAGWAERRARLAHKRVVESRTRALRDDRAELLVDASLEDMTELGFVDDRPYDSEEVGHGQVLRAAVNDLQHRLLTADPQADVHGFALERLMTAARADRVCAFMNRTGADGRVEHELYAEAVVSPELSLQGSDAAAAMAYEDFIPGLFERLATGAPFSSRTEFLPKPAAAHLAVQAVEAVLLLPLFVGGAFHGFLRLDRCDHARLWSEPETGILVSAAGSISAAIERQRVVAKLVDQATRDGLTGLANHRHFYDRLAEELDRAARYGQPLALLMLDIDDFKKLNDTYGHPAGDEVLRLIGRLLHEELRSGGDLAARYGGEEFCVILPNSGAVRQPSGAQRADEGGGTELSGNGPHDAGALHEGEDQCGAAALAERLRRRIAAYDFPIGPGGAPVRVTVSIGVASFPLGAAQMEELVEHADTALYVAKRAGKDRIAVY